MVKSKVAAAGFEPATKEKANRDVGLILGASQDL